jgi:inorganic pyrophosphatase
MRASSPADAGSMLDRLPIKHGKRLNVIVETPRGSRNKFSYDSELGLFRLGKQLPAGAVFPFDFGFVPSTRSGDGDPLDALVLIDSATFPGCLVRARLLGVMLGRQTGRSGRTVDNPRLIAVGTKSNEYDGVRTLRDLPDALVDEIEYFFVSYTAASGKVFKPMGRYGRKGARSVLSSAEANHKKHLRPEVISTLPNSMPGDRRENVVASKGERVATGTDARHGRAEDVKRHEAPALGADGSSGGHRRQAHNRSRPNPRP